MDDRILDPDGAQDRLAAWKDRIDQLAADTKAMSDQLEELRLTVADSNRICEVTLDHSGNIVDLQLSSRMNRARPEDVARTIMETVQEAKHRLADRSREIIETTLGADSAAGRAIAGRVRNQLDPDDDSDQNGRG
ncbi:YbaB/EbfC family nucleoid-associated protein [Glycomyces xiaoerkulensis]|uniref:YbaB/EbfC family nucleoid-associated protein n=1 Tax=Glycomyces xiaoerkulensis TaxID=2038139 RepID=UPI000C25854C|nr:YbaB/EbfC family nucleoid-associated protein [Glycomyces xiaoerkulensis]